MAQKPFVLVTGGTGFLGSHVVLQLLDAGYRVRCTARALKARFLEEAHRARRTQFEIVEVEDIANADLTEALRVFIEENLGKKLLFVIRSQAAIALFYIRGGSSTRAMIMPIQNIFNEFVPDIEAVIHVAFPAPGSMEPVDLLVNGVNSTTNLLRQAHEHGIGKFVLTSSYLAVVGAEAESVWRDYTFTDRDWSMATYDAAFDGTQDPAWVYAAAKKLAEAAAWDFVRSRPGMDLASVIPALLIGPFAPGHAILSTGDLSTNVLLHSLIVSQIPPHPVWPQFVDVRDAATAHIRALEAPSLPLPSASALPPVPSTPPPDILTASTSTASLSDLGFRATPLPSPTLSRSSFPHHPLPLKKRFIASGPSFTWPEAIAHLREVRPDLAATLPDERACAALPEKVAQPDSRWTGARSELDGITNGAQQSGTGFPEEWTGITVPWRDWKQTIEDAVRDLESVAQGLEKSGWEELFGDQEEDQEDQVVPEPEPKE